MNIYKNKLNWYGNYAQYTVIQIIWDRILFFSHYWVTFAAEKRSIHQQCNRDIVPNSSRCERAFYFGCTSLINLRALNLTDSCKKPFSLDKIVFKEQHMYNSHNVVEFIIRMIKIILSTETKEDSRVQLTLLSINRLNC